MGIILTLLKMNRETFISKVKWEIKRVVGDDEGKLCSSRPGRILYTMILNSNSILQSDSEPFES